MSEKISSEEIRERFLEFFRNRDHRRIPDSGLIPANDPTLLFINSGMAPLKRFFTGQEKPPYPRLCNVQPCLRTSDIDEVGDRHHLTLFEMLGSWSIGDYFKSGAIELAYELLTDGFQLDPDRLYVTVFSGDSQRNIAPDDESARYWEAVGIKRDHVIPLGIDDNFWGPAGETGPCGPCTEVFYDTGPEYGEAYVPGALFDTTKRYIEIWNAGVFMQFDKQRDGSLVPLPFTSVDTGSGLERLTMTLNNQASVYDTDLLAPLQEMVGKVLNDTGELLDHHRLIADHMRTATFVLAEGVRPSNEGRGYIPRRLIRKSMTVARQAGADSLDLAPVVESVIERMGSHYPHLQQRRDQIMQLLDEERRDFERAMHKGLEHLDDLLDAGRGVSGRDAFRLFSTYGLPFEVTRELSAARGLTVDEETFREEFKSHQETSRGVAAADGERRLSRTDPLSDLPAPGTEHFIGYESLVGQSRIVAVFVDGELRPCASEGDAVEILAAGTPFYAEGGGQIGDRGRIVTSDGEVEVDDTVKHGSGYHVHRGRVTTGTVCAEQVAMLEVNPEARIAAQANHSATHLLNAALRIVLGPHVKQAGSLVEPERLRFDFTHDAPLKPEQIRQIEQLVNEQIFQDHRRELRVLPPQEAVDSGAVYLAGEDYGPAVRVVSFDGFSREFCGGTHVHATGEIGLFRVVSEQSVAAGVRRLTALTGPAALDWTLTRESVLTSAARELKTNVTNLPQRIAQLVEASRSGAKAGQPSDQSLPDLKAEVSPAGIPVAVVSATEKGNFRKAASEAAERLGALVCVVATTDGKATVLVAVPAVLSSDFDARRILNSLLADRGGKGGGSARLAQGGMSVEHSPEDVLRRFPDIVDQERAVGANAPS